MSTMALSEQGGARGAEPYLAAECEEAAIGLVLIDEGLKSGVDDFNLAPQAGEVTRAGDEIVAKVDDRPTVLATVGREIRRRVGRIAKDVPPARAGEPTRPSLACSAPVAPRRGRPSSAHTAASA